MPAIYKTPGEKLTNGKKSQEGDLWTQITEDGTEGQSVLSKSPDFSVQSL